MSVREALRNWDHLALSVLDISYLFLSHVTLLMYEFPYEFPCHELKYNIIATKKTQHFVYHESLHIWREYVYCILNSQWGLFSFYTYDFTTFSTLLERWTDRKFRKYIPSLILQINIKSIQWKCLMFKITSVCATPKIQTFHGIENSTNKKSE